MAITNTTGYVFGTGSADVIARTETKEYTINIVAKDNTGAVAGTARGGVKTTTSVTKYASSAAPLSATVVRTTVSASNEDFVKATEESEVYGS